MAKIKDDNKLDGSSPSPRDESKIKRRRTNDDEEKHRSKKKHRSHKSSEHRSRKDKKSGAKHKDKSRKKHSKLKIQQLSNEDYFSKNNEFAMWLKNEKNIYFSDLSSDSARSLFSEFVAEWNNQVLEPQYYEGVVAGPRTSHKWNIKR
ncbi:pentatricopeptide repeat-containing protein [Dorcoceras hygrometricum]|uniref:Pentatricopeptide repeat-containing protein n=1 Tax=Dorcoceras hygrometricum TaxID=472368 RepID=A0A2Z6ZYX6_9LAMI|nr:pentatricopeptide repeat-containing protein [Dorcoceras hygrometricum]